MTLRTPPGFPPAFPKTCVAGPLNTRKLSRRAIGSVNVFFVFVCAPWHRLGWQPVEGDPRLLLQDSHRIRRIGKWMLLSIILDSSLLFSTTPPLFKLHGRVLLSVPSALTDRPQLRRTRPSLRKRGETKPEWLFSLCVAVNS